MESEKTDVTQESEVNTADISNTQDTADRESFGIDEASQKLQHLAQDLNLNISNPLFQSADSTENVKLLLKYVTLTRALLAKRSATKCQKTSVTTRPTQEISETSDQANTKLNMTSQFDNFHDSDENSTGSFFGKISFDFLQSTENTTDFSSQTQGGNNAYMPDHLLLQNVPEASVLPCNSELHKDTLQSAFESRIETQSGQNENTETSWENNRNCYFSNQLISSDRVSNSRIHTLPDNNSPSKTVQQTSFKLCHKSSDTSDASDIPAKMFKLKDTEHSDHSSHLVYSKNINVPWQNHNSDSARRKMTVDLSSQRTFKQQHDVSNSENKFSNISSDNLFPTKVGHSSCQERSPNNLVLTDLMGISQNPHVMQNSTSGVMQNSTSGVMQNSTSGVMQNSTSDVIQNSTGGVLQNSTGGALQNSVDGALQNSTGGALQNSTGGALQNSTGGALQNSVDGALQNSTGGALQNSTSGTMQNSSHIRTTDKCKRYNKTADALKRSGLMEVTMKTAELLQRNRSLQKEIDNLKKESVSFLKDVLQNPENERIKEKIMHSLPQ